MTTNKGYFQQSPKNKALIVMKVVKTAAREQTSPAKIRRTKLEDDHSSIGPESATKEGMGYIMPFKTEHDHIEHSEKHGCKVTRTTAAVCHI